MQYTATAFVGVIVMSEFYIDINRCKTIPDSIYSLEKSLNSAAERLQSVGRSMKFNSGSGFDIIRERISQITQSSLNEVAKAASLKDALGTIVMCYNTCENGLSGYASNHMTFINDTKTEDKNESWWDKLVAWIKKIFGIKEEEPLSAARQREKEHDLYMQNEIFALLERQGYTESAWKNMSIEQRKQMLERLLPEIALIMGITISSRIDFYDGPKNNNGYYDGEIHINANKLEGSDSYSITQTLIHEMRHAYQHAAVENPENFNVSSETIDQWRENFNNYVDSGTNGERYKEYVSQPIEYDAKSFARQSTYPADPSYTGSW